MGRRAEQPLVNALSAQDEKVRTFAARILSRIGYIPTLDETGVAFWIARQSWAECVAVGEVAVPYLIDLLKGVHIKDRHGPVEALAKIGRPAVEPLIDLLKGEDWFARRDAARALGLIGDPCAVDYLVDALEDKDRDVLESVAVALGKIKDPRALQPLIAALEHEERDIKLAASEALGLIADQRAVYPLVLMLNDDDKFVREAAAWSLAKMGWQPENAYCDRGYRGNSAKIDGTQVHVVGRRKKSISRSGWRWYRRRAAIEPMFGHLKAENRMDRNRLHGKEGDRINAILSGCGYNMRKLLRAFFLLIFNWLFSEQETQKRTDLAVCPMLNAA